MIRGALAALGPALVVLGYAVVVGSAVRLAAQPWVRLPRGLGVTAGLGLAVAAAAVSVAYVTSADAVAPVLPLLWLALLVLAAVVARAVVAVRRGGPRLSPLLGDLLPVPADALAVVAALVVLGPILRLGLTYWTSFANDYPNYAASVQVWSSADGSGPTFLERHPDGFGEYQVWRADVEKPMSTGLLVVVARLTGLPAWGLLTPTMLVATVVLVSALLTVVRVALPRAGALGALAVLVPSLSIVPVSRLLDAQVGHVVAVALAAVAVATFSGATRTGSRGSPWVHAGLAGLALAVCLGANASLVVGTLPTLAALTAWVALRRGVRVRDLLLDVARSAGVVVLVSAPFVTWYLDAVQRQGGGEPGFGIPLAGPAALLGLQPSLEAAGDAGDVGLQWAVVLAVAAASYVLYRRRVPGSWWTGALVAVTALNGVALVVRFSSSNYSVHKWLAVAVALVAPVLLARAVEAARTRVVRAVPVAAVVLVCLAVAGSNVWRAAEAVRAAVPPELLALADAPEVSGDRTVNVSLGTVYEDSLAPLVLDTARVLVTGVTYAEPACPEGDALLTRDTSLPSWPHTAVTPLGGGLVLADLDLRVDAGTVRLGTRWPESAAHLCGRWQAPEDGGVRAGDASASIVLDLADGLRGRAVTLTLLGEWETGDASPAVGVNGTPVPVTIAESGDLRSMTVRVPPALVADGRIVVSPWRTVASAPPETDDTGAGRLLVSFSVVGG